MSSQRTTPTAGSSRAAPSPSSPSAARSTSVSRSLGTPPRDSTRGAASVSSSVIMGRAGAHATPSSRSVAASLDFEAGPELIAQLQERLQHLEAEAKASQDTAQWTIKQNKNTLLALKQENKDLSAEVSRRGGSTELQGKQGTATDGERVIERLERQVHEFRRAYDKVVKDKKTALQKLDNLHDSLKDMAKVAAAVPGAAAAAASVSSMPLSASLSSAPSASAIAAAAAAAAASLPANSPAARELRQLQNRLEKATVKANEAYSIRKTYEQVLEKVRQEEPLLESRIRALEEQKATKLSALQTATLYGREVQAAKETAKATLTALEEEVTANRTRRARVLAEMREKAATLQQTNRALMQRQFIPLTAPTPEASDASAGGGAAGTVGGGGVEKRPPNGGESSAAEMEDITARDLIVKLCRITGARRVSELVARLMAQQESYANLVEMRNQATAQRLALVQELEVLRQHRDELRGGGKMSTQKQMDAAQEELRDAASRADAAGEALEALLRAHADVRSGLEHLATMVSPLPLPPGGLPAVPLEDESLGDVLAQIEQRLVGAYKVIAALPKAVEMLESMYASLRQ